MNTLLEIANAVVAELAGYDAELSFAADYNLPKLSTRRVVVVPMSKECKIISRASAERIHRIEVGVMQRAKDIDLTTLIPMVESIGLPFLGKRLLSEVCVEVSWEPIYSADDLRAKNQFTSVLVLIFKEVS